MSPKKPYQKRLPTVLPPTPRPSPEQQQRPPEGPPPPPPARAPEDDTHALAPAPVRASAPTPPPPRTPEPARELRTLVLAGVALVGVAAGVALVWQVVGTDEPSPTPAASLPIDGWPAAGESRTVTEVLPDGDLSVTHWIHADRPLDELGLALPAPGAGVEVSADEVEVVADGRVAPGPDAVARSGASYAVDDATRVQVRYRLSGAVQRSSSAEGRGLATTTSLDVTATQARDVRVVRSQEVLSLACAATGQQPVPCGVSGGEDQWRVELPGDGSVDRVLAVVTIPS